MNKLLIAILFGAAAIAFGCKDDKATGTASPPGASSGSSGGATATPHAGDPHNRLPLGETTVAGLKLTATMDEPVKPGGEGAFDLVITGGKPKAVRFWVGIENAEGSVKARAEEETANNWHTHVEVPDPLPPESKFWAEVEPAAGEPFKVSFDLKRQ